MDINDARSLVTLFSFVLFLVLAGWALLPSRRAELDAAALLPFTGEAQDLQRGASPERRAARGEQ